jgi:PAS domain S-box-containing protein
MPVAYVDRCLRHRFVNKNFEQWLKLPADSIIDRPVQDLLGEAAYAQFAKHLEMILAGSEATVEARMPHPYGGAQWIRMTYAPYTDAQGVVIGLLALGEDVTYRRQLEERLRASEERLDHLIEGSIQGILIHQQGKAVFVNQTYAELHGYESPSNIYALPSLLELVAPHDRDRFIRYHDERIAGKTAPTHYEFQGLKRDGALIWLDAIARLIVWEGAPAVQFIVVDKTASKQAQEALQRDDRLALLGRMAATFSHEVKNPLQALRLYADILEEEVAEHFPNSATDSRHIIDDALMVIREKATRMGDVVQDYLSLARLNAISREPEDLGALIMGIVRDQREALRRHGLTLRLDGIEDLGCALIHPNTLRRAIYNFIQNAMEAMSGGGVLTLRGRQAAAYLQLDIVDTGPGIPPETLSEIFTPFHTTKALGRGLGLYVAQEIIAAHEGQVIVESELGCGATFTLTLPRSHYGACEQGP